MTNIINITNDSERTIQKSIKNFDIGTYMIVQKKMFLQTYIDIRII